MPPITRREFLKYSAGAAALAGAGWKIASEAAPSAVSPSIPVAAPTNEKIVPTICTMCPSNCGLSVRVAGGKAVKVEGNSLHPLNQGVCCPKGQASLEVLYSPERVRQPIQRNRFTGEWKNISWEEALNLVATRLQVLRADGQSHSLAILFGETRGQLRGLIQRFLDAFGSPNGIELIEPDVQAARLAMFLMQGINGIPVYQWERTRYVLAFGASFLEAGRHLMPALSGAGFMRRGTPNRGKFVVIDPRFSVSAAKADEWIPIRPGTLGALALGMANVMISSHLYDEKFVRDFTFGFEDFNDDHSVTHRGFKSLVLQEYTLARVEAITGVPSGTVARLAGEFASSRPAVALWPTGSAALASGNALSSAMAVYALNALVGSIDAPGGVIVQRYPQLAEWPRYIPDAIAQKGSAVERVDGAGTSENPFAISMPNALAARILAKQPYPIQALFLIGANPIFDLPQGKRFAEALDAVPLVISFSSIKDESAAHADLIFPSATSLESWGDAFVEGTGYAGLALAQPAVSKVYETRHPGDVLLALAQKMGGSIAEALAFADYASLLKQRVAGSEINWDDLVKKGAWSQMMYFNATPGSRVWNTEVIGHDRVAAPRDGRFDLFPREMFYALKSAGADVTDLDVLPHFDLPASDGDARLYPFLLTPVETMTQPRGWNGIVPTLQEVYGVQAGVRWDSWVEISVQAARALGIQDGDRVWVESAHSKLQARAKLTSGLWTNAVAMPLGQGHFTGVAWGRESEGGVTIGANPLALCGQETEKWSGLPVITPTRVNVYKA